MLKIERRQFDELGFNLDEAIARFKQAREDHKNTVNVPAPVAHPLVEEALFAGGYVIEEPEPPPVTSPEALKRMEEMQALRAATVKKLSEWKGTTAEKLDFLRETLVNLLTGSLGV